MPTGRGFDLFGGGGIKSVQHGVITIANTDSVNVNISSIDPNNSIIKISYQGTRLSNISDANVLASIVNSTTVNFRRGRSSSESITVYWEVIEFNKVKTKQTGTTLITGWEHEVSISTINVSKSFIVSSMRAFENGTGANHVLFGSRIKDSNTIILSAYPTISAEVHWQVIEFE